jgi:hypothetical protein
MRAHTITTMTRHRRNARRRVIALVLGVCAVAIPASASAQLIPSDHKSAATASIAPAESSLRAARARANERVRQEAVTREPTVVALRRDGSQAEPTVVSDSPSYSGDGFDWGDAAVGAGAAMALVALGGAALFTVRRRPGGLPSASTG